MIKEKIVDCLKKTIVFLPFTPDVFIPENEQFGHYSTNVALKLAKLSKKKPLEVAENLKSSILNLKSDFFQKIEVAPPGFVNFWLSEKVLQDELKDILKQKEKYGRSTLRQAQGKKVQIEFISANPTGPLTIGNGRGGFFGDVLANILKFVGHKVAREYYVNDAKVSAQIKELGKTAMGEGKTYSTKNLESQIAKIGAKLKNLSASWRTKKLKNDLYGEAGYLLAQEIQKNNKKFIEKILKIKFDKWFSEESLYQNGSVNKILSELKKKNLVYEKDGALWLKTSDFSDSEDRVLVRKSRLAGQVGEPTYFLPDLAYHLNKFKIRKFNKVIDIWGADHHGYEPRLRAGLKALGIFENGDGKFQVIITQLARLIRNGEEVKMSKRKGEYITLEDLIKEIGLDAARFFFLMSSPGTHMNFDLSLAKEKSLKNPVYYAQYAAVRCQSILRKAKSEKRKAKINFNLLSTKEDLDLMRMLARFPEIIEEAAENYNPQILARYSMDLARQFHNFYEKEKVIGLDNKETVFARLILIEAALTVFKNIFSLLGVSLPRKM
ncbi:arginine--tRNA ligase [Candidatus Wolfebacteria bacterium]|nr:arginine--tRNA ligase [Candidatus Wolfebacteria bacterium]